MNTISNAGAKCSVEVIIVPVRDVDRALRFYVDQVGFALDVDYTPNDVFRVVAAHTTRLRLLDTDRQRDY